MQFRLQAELCCVADIHLPPLLPAAFCCHLLLLAASGEMIKAIRTQHMADATNSNKVASMVADNFALLNNTMPKVLNVVHAAHKVRMRMR
jgi:hypothetical protein